MIRLLGLLFTAGFLVFCAGAMAVGYVIYDKSADLPTLETLTSYEPPVMTRVHAGDGSLLAEYAEQRRLYTPASVLPKRLVHAFISAEDKTFFSHAGIDWQGIVAAVVRYGQSKLKGENRRLAGASTITQQVAKNFFLSNDRSFERKLKEALLAQRIEQAFSKEQILELYLNEIYLGLGSYGVAAASLNYFGKSLKDLQLEEMAYLAALPKAPSNYHPFRQTERALERRNWVLGQMHENGYITADELNAASNKPLDVNPRPYGVQLFASEIGAEAFAEEVRRDLEKAYGRKRLREGGLSVRTTLDLKLQIFARQALQRGLMKFDRERGWRGPVAKLNVQEGDWGAELGKVKAYTDLRPWRLAIVLEVTPDQAKIGLQPDRLKSGKLDEKRETAVLPVKYMTWAREHIAGKEGKFTLGKVITSVDQVLSPGDVVYTAPSQEQGQHHLVQVPEVEGGLVALDPHTGRVLALSGGFSYARSQFNRAVQAKRQPGSSFKPFVYAAALDNGYTPASVVLDAPFEIRQSNGEVWRPKNYTKKFYGPSTLRRGIELSRNVMTVRLAHDMGMKKVVQYARDFGVYDNLRPVLAMSLGAGETSLLRMTAAFSMFVNGGKRITPSLVDRVQDRRGRTVFRHDARDCSACKVEKWEGQAEPELVDARRAVINPYTAYQITSMLEGVVQRGTAKKAFKDFDVPIAGKTGTTNDEKDAWFVGFSPDLAVGVYIGYDNPRPMGRSASGGGLAAPIFADFMKLALRGKPHTPFRVPRGIQLIPINPKNGERAPYGAETTILEAFKPGEEPTEDNNVVIGGDPGFVPSGVSQVDTSARDGGLTTGTGGLY